MHHDRQRCGRGHGYGADGYAGIFADGLFVKQKRRGHFRLSAGWFCGIEGILEKCLKDLKEKIDPYLRPLYDALYEMLGKENTEKYIEKGIIEIAPLAYMRGRTLEDAFIILDEAQNTTTMQMKMFLTRLGFNSKMVITGDITQIDLRNNVKSGLQQVKDILQGIKEIKFIVMDTSDVCRHPLVQKIIECYDALEQ